MIEAMTMERWMEDGRDDIVIDVTKASFDEVKHNGSPTPSPHSRHWLRRGGQPPDKVNLFDHNPGTNQRLLQ